MSSTSITKRIIYFQLLNENGVDMGDIDCVEVNDDINIVYFRNIIQKHRKILADIDGADLKVFSNRSHIQDASKVCFVFLLELSLFLFAFIEEISE